MTHFYIVTAQDDDLWIFKLGFTSNVGSRLSMLRTGNHRNLVAETYLMRDALVFEKFVHRAFKDNHVRGEWYELSEKELAFLQANARNASLECDCKTCNSYFINREKVPIEV